MEWKQATIKDDATTIPKSWIHIHYYDALNSLFRLENSLRIFVYMVLKNHFFDQWDNINITSDDAETATILTIAKKRQNQAQDFGYLGYGIKCPVMHLTSGELIRIITDDNYWKHFKPYFPASKQIIKHKLDEIGVIRNSLAHFRPLKSTDVQLIKQNAEHALSGVDHYLRQLGLCFNVVPTNTEEDWYPSLSILGKERCTLVLTQCEDERWVSLTFTYKSHVLSSYKYSPQFITHTILNLITPSILENYKNITKYATCLTEQLAVPGPQGYNPDEPSFTKSFSILFDRDVIKTHHEELKNDIESLLRTISEETDLIISDNLARGKLVSVARISAFIRKTEEKQWWDVHTIETLCSDIKGEFPEYWGNTQLFSSMLTSSQKYPWMPTEVSQSEF